MSSRAYVRDLILRKEMSHVVRHDTVAGILNFRFWIEEKFLANGAN